MRRLSGLFGKLASKQHQPKEALSPKASPPPPTTTTATAQPSCALLEDLFLTSPLIQGSVAMLWSALGLKEDQVECLYFLHLCKCRSLLDLSSSEFACGMQALGCGTLQDLAKRLPASYSKITTSQPAAYREFFAFCFQASREGTVKTVDKATVLFLLPILLQGSPYASRSALFCEYLAGHRADLARIKYDEWQSFLQFCRTVPDLAKYTDEGSSWPLLIDDFAQWANSK